MLKESIMDTLTVGLFCLYVEKVEIALLHCLPRVLYGCEGMLLSTLQTRELDVIWNNAFRYILTVVGMNR